MEQTPEKNNLSSKRTIMKKMSFAFMLSMFCNMYENKLMAALVPEEERDASADAATSIMLSEPARVRRPATQQAAPATAAVLARCRTMTPQEAYRRAQLLAVARHRHDALILRLPVLHNTLARMQQDTASFVQECTDAAEALRATDAAVQDVGQPTPETFATYNALAQQQVVQRRHIQTYQKSLASIIQNLQKMHQKLVEVCPENTSAPVAPAPSHGTAASTLPY